MRLLLIVTALALTYFVANTARLGVDRVEYAQGFEALLNK